MSIRPVSKRRNFDLSKNKHLSDIFYIVGVKSVISVTEVIIQVR